jgi:hypothetical protein
MYTHDAMIVGGLTLQDKITIVNRRFSNNPGSRSVIAMFQQLTCGSHMFCGNAFE